MPDLTGNPGPLAAKLGGDQGQPGGLGVGGETTFRFRTTARKARITAMVHPDYTPDNYVTALVELNAPGTTELVRYDIGDVRQRLLSLAAHPTGARVELDRLWLHPQEEQSAELALTDAEVDAEIIL